MRFGKAPYHLIGYILAADPKLGLTLLNKVDLADAYMRIWVYVEEIPSVEFLVPKATIEEENLVGFHLYIPMGGVLSSAFLCITTEVAKYRALAIPPQENTTLPHPLESFS